MCARTHTSVLCCAVGGEILQQNRLISMESPQSVDSRAGWSHFFLHQVQLLTKSQAVLTVLTFEGAKSRHISYATPSSFIEPPLLEYKLLHRRGTVCRHLWDRGLITQLISYNSFPYFVLCSSPFNQRSSLSNPLIAETPLEWTDVATKVRCLCSRVRIKLRLMNMPSLTKKDSVWQAEFVFWCAVSINTMWL